MGLFHVAIRGRDRKHLVALQPKFRVIVVGYREDKRGAVVDAFIPSEKIPYLRRKGYDVTLIEEVTAHDRDRQAEGRAAVEVRLKKGRYGDVIWGGGYLTSDEVEKAMVMGEKNHAGSCERIPLPNLTWEKRRCHALRIGTGGGKGRMAICLMAGTHGREWGGPDILVYFGIRLLRAYRDKKPIKLGRRTFTAAQVRWLVENREILLFPLVNPDGRHFSMERHPMWRKNRRPAPKGRSHKSIGVDLNRNFPFLWHFDRHFAPGTVQSSRKPGEYETYIGPREASEPETRNVIWLLDQCDNIRYFVDLHSYGETILHSWGSDNNQYDNPRMSFRNKRYDGKRGQLDDDAYREYIPAADEKEAAALARRMATAIGRVRGRKYLAQQSVGLYPTAGAADDYVYSRHLADPKKPRVLSFTVEWGRSRASTPFHPPYPEMRSVMREMTAGLIEFCLKAGTK